MKGMRATNLLLLALVLVSGCGPLVDSVSPRRADGEPISATRQTISTVAHAADEYGPDILGLLGCIVPGGAAVTSIAIAWRKARDAGRAREAAQVSEDAFADLVRAVQVGRAALSGPECGGEPRKVLDAALGDVSAETKDMVKAVKNAERIQPVTP